MNLKKVNSNYKYNEIHNSGKIKQIVEEMMKEKTNPAPFDFLFRNGSRDYPEINHKVLELPGKFKQLEDTAVFVFGEGVHQMDYAQSVLPDGKMVKREAAVDTEHQSIPLGDDKAEDIFHYCLYTTIKLKKPCYPVVVTNYGEDKSSKTYCFEGISFTIYFRVFDKEKIYKILNTLSTKDYNTIEFSDEDYLNFLYSMIFAKPPYAKDFIEKAVGLFISIEKINLNHQFDLHLALKMLIKYHFRGDDDKIEELLTMITKAVPSSKTDELSGYETKRIDLDEARIMASQAKSEAEEYKSMLNEARDENKKLKEILHINGIAF